MKKASYALEKAIGQICRYIGYIGMAVLMGMMLLTVIDITLRRVFNSPLPYSFELTENFLVVVAFCSIAFTTSVGRHISINVLVEKSPPWARKYTERVTDLICVAVFFLVAWRSTLRAIHMIDIGQVTGVLEMPYYPFFFVVALGSALAGLTILLQMVNSSLREAKP